MPITISAYQRYNFIRTIKIFQSFFDFILEFWEIFCTFAIVMRLEVGAQPHIIEIMNFCIARPLLRFDGLFLCQFLNSMIMSKQIQLTHGKVAIVDAEDYEYLMQWKWCVNSGGYAVRSENFKTPDGRKTARTVRMHRVILNPAEHLQVDHINNNKLDNRRCNLRECTNEENGRNRPKPSVNSSGFKGIEWLQRNKKWRARIRIDKKLIHLGLFESPTEAAKAYNNAALKYHNEFANLNQIPE